MGKKKSSKIQPRKDERSTELVGFKTSLDVKQTFETISQNQSVFNAGFCCSLPAKDPRVSSAEDVRCLFSEVVQNQACTLAGRDF